MGDGSGRKSEGWGSALSVHSRGIAMTPRDVPCKLKMSQLLKVLEDITFKRFPFRGWKGCVIVAYPKCRLDLSAVISNCRMSNRLHDSNKIWVPLCL
jgi:hypothetical protein